MLQIYADLDKECIDIIKDETFALEHLNEMKFKSSNMQGPTPIIPPLVSILDNTISKESEKKMKQSTIENSIPEDEVVSNFSPLSLNQGSSTLIGEIKDESKSHSKDFSTRRKIEKPDLSISVENISCENPSNIENLQVDYR